MRCACCFRRAGNHRWYSTDKRGWSWKLEAKHDLSSSIITVNGSECAYKQAPCDRMPIGYVPQNHHPHASMRKETTAEAKVAVVPWGTAIFQVSLNFSRRFFRTRSAVNLKVCTNFHVSPADAIFQAVAFSFFLHSHCREPLHACGKAEPTGSRISPNTEVHWHGRQEDDPLSRYMLSASGPHHYARNV